MANLYDKAGLVNIPVGYQDGFLYNIKPEDNTLGFRFNRDSAATRVNKEGLIEQVGYFGPELVQNGNFSELGPELVVNGDFATDSDWIKDAGVTISDGKANWNNTSNNIGIAQNGALTIGKTYKIKFTVSNYVSGSVRIRFPFIEQRIQANGTYIFYGVATTDDLYIQGETQGGNPQFSIDNVSVKQVDPNDYWTLGTGWSFGDGVASCDGSQTGFVTINQSNVVAPGKLYKVKFTLTRSAGSIRPEVGSSGLGTFVAESGTFTQYITQAGNNTLYFKSDSNFVGSITNISLIEVKGDKPRIDYTDSLTSPSFLLEPQSTNLVEFSEDFSNDWASGNIINTANQTTSPDGANNGTQLQPTQASGVHILNIFAASSAVKTYSVFAKQNGYKRFRINTGSSSNGFASFDLNTGSVVSVGGTYYSNSNIKDYGNGWYRCSITFLANAPASFTIAIEDNEGQVFFAGDGVSSIYAWGAQVEELSYATSYIPTAGSTVTRAQETCNGAGNVSTFNSTEGVLYAEIAALANQAGYRYIALTDGTVVNRVDILYRNDLANTITSRLKVGTDQARFDVLIDNELNYNKFAISWKQNEVKFFVNGVQQGSTDTNANVPPANTFNELLFNRGDGLEEFFGKVKGIYVFNEALTDDELQQLTGPEYNSFAALAAAYNYTVI